MGEEHWLTDPRFKDDISRGDNGAIISERMSRWCAERHDCRSAGDSGQGARSRPGPCSSRSRRWTIPTSRPWASSSRPNFPAPPKPAPIAKVPVWLSETPGSIRRRAPTLGEHTDQILAELGYDKKAIAALREKGVI